MKMRALARTSGLIDRVHKRQDAMGVVVVVVWHPGPAGPPGPGLQTRTQSPTVGVRVPSLPPGPDGPPDQPPPARRAEYYQQPAGPRARLCA
jgi:hypothetical protein